MRKSYQLIVLVFILVIQCCCSCGAENQENNEFFTKRKSFYKLLCSLTSETGFTLTRDTNNVPSDMPFVMPENDFGFDHARMISYLSSKEAQQQIEEMRSIFNGIYLQQDAEIDRSIAYYSMKYILKCLGDMVLSAKCLLAALPPGFDNEYFDALYFNSNRISLRYWKTICEPLQAMGILCHEYLNSKSHRSFCKTEGFFAEGCMFDEQLVYVKEFMSSLHAFDITGSDMLVFPVGQFCATSDAQALWDSIKKCDSTGNTFRKRISESEWQETENVGVFDQVENIIEFGKKYNGISSVEKIPPKEVESFFGAVYGLEDSFESSLVEPISSLEQMEESLI